MADVFLSYARACQATATRAASRLEAAGRSVWYDANLPAHRNYSDVIAEQLNNAGAILVLWSEAAVQSQWVRSEANRARESGRLVQARLDDAALPMPFDQIQCADLRDWSGQQDHPGWTCVVDSIAELLGGAPSTLRTTAPRQIAATDRRKLLVGAGGLAALAGAGMLTWKTLSDDQPSPEAQLLLQKGMDALQQVDALDNEQPASSAQAVALLTKATEANPQSSTAWGALAMAYAVNRRAAPPANRPGLAERSRSAAERALAGEKNEPRALAALSMLDPVYRNWLPAERIRRDRWRSTVKFPIGLFLLSDVLGSVGRWRDAAALSDSADRTRFLIPGADRKVVVNLWCAGRLQEADTALNEAVDRWPDHPQVWRTRLAYLLYSGRPSDALRLIDDSDNLPAAIPAGLMEAARATGRALTGEGKAQDAVTAGLAYAKGNPGRAPQVAQACAAVGDSRTAFSLLDGYYFGAGEWASMAPPGGDEDRHTAPLFQPPMRALWREPSFQRLLDRVGLTAYWKASGTRPDFRRA